MSREDIVDLKKLLNIEENEESVALFLYKESPYLLKNEDELANFIVYKKQLLDDNRNKLTPLEFYDIDRKLDYIIKTARNFPFIFKTSINNKYYLKKYHEEVKALYLTNQEMKIVLAEIATELEKNNFSRDCVKKIYKQYGLSDIYVVFDLLNHYYREYELDAKLVNLGIMPNTKGYIVTTNKKYKMVYEFKLLLDKVINTNDENEIMNITYKMLDVISASFLSFSKEYSSKKEYTILTVAKMLYDDNTYQKIVVKLEKCFDIIEEKTDKIIREKRKEKNSQKREIINKEKLSKANENVLSYINNHDSIDKDTLIENLAFIKSCDNDLYLKYLKMMYGISSKETIIKFLEGNYKSINEFLEDENISKRKFDIYRQLIDDDLKERLAQKLKNNMDESYKKLKHAINEMLNRIKNNSFDYANLLQIANENKISLKTLLESVQLLKKKYNYYAIQRLEQMIIQCIDDIKKYPLKSRKLMSLVSSIKEYGNVTFSSDIHDKTLKYLEDNNIPLTYLSYRSILLRYSKNKFFFDDKKTK